MSELSRLIEDLEEELEFAHITPVEGEYTKRWILKLAVAIASDLAPKPKEVNTKGEKK